MHQDELAALHLEALEAPQEAHAEKVGGERALLGDRGRYIAHGDVLDAHAVERHWRHARDAVRRLGDASRLRGEWPSRSASS